MINAYASTSSAQDEQVEEFYDDTEKAMADRDSKYKIITGDFNAEFGDKNKSRRLQKQGSSWKRGEKMKEGNTKTSQQMHYFISPTTDTRHRSH